MPAEELQWRHGNASRIRGIPIVRNLRIRYTIEICSLKFLYPLAGRTEGSQITRTFRPPCLPPRHTDYRDREVPSSEGSDSPPRNPTQTHGATAPDARAQRKRRRIQTYKRPFPRHKTGKPTPETSGYQTQTKSRTLSRAKGRENAVKVALHSAYSSWVSEAPPLLTSENQ